MGYERHREVIKIRTELTFDALGIAEAAADMTFGLVLYPERANRLVEYHARNSSQPSLESIMDKLINATFKSSSKIGYEGAIQQVTNNALFVSLALLSQHKDASAQSKAIALLKLDQLKTWLTLKIATAADEEWKAHYAYLLQQLKLLQENPTEFKAESLFAPPPGQPIGMDLDFCGN